MGTRIAGGCSASAVSSRPSTAPKVSRSTWTSLDGLPQNTVNDIAQDPLGYLWVCTFGGLARFDDYDEKLPLLVADTWDKDGIPTYVIGIDIDDSSEHPFTNPRQKLDELAKLGGVPREGGEVGFYDAADAQSLMSALDEIAASVACGVQLGQAPAGPDELVITIDGQPIPHLQSCDEGFGWVYANANLTSIELCNDACDMLHDSGEIQAEFTCPPQP